MKRLIRCLMMILIFIILTACGIFEGQTAQFSGENKTYELSHEEHGIALHANIEVGQNIKVEASLENISGETIVFNGRCGIPFYIHAEMKGTSAHLSMSTNQEIVDCESIFDPNDLEDFLAGEVIEKTATFKRQFELSNGFTTPAHDGDYNIQFSFRSYENGDLQSVFPVALTHESDPEILTVEEAKTYSLEHEEVKRWFDQQQVSHELTEANEELYSRGDLKEDETK